MSGFMPIRYSGGNISGSGGVMTKAKLWARIIGCFQMNRRAHVRGKNAALFCVTTLTLSSYSTARMLISQRLFRRIRTGISETYKHFNILASDVYTFLNRAAGVT